MGRNRVFHLLSGAPYHAVDIYVRGEMGEGWAMVWFPLILWTAYRLIKSDKKQTVKWIIACPFLGRTFIDPQFNGHDIHAGLCRLVFYLLDSRP